MGARRTWRHRALATKGAAVVLAVALVAGCGDTSTRSNGSAEEEVPLAEVSGEVTGEITVAERSGVTAPAARRIYRPTVVLRPSASVLPALLKRPTLPRNC